MQAGLHPATGGSGELVCSGDMLLQALAAAGSLRAVATALDLPVRGGRVTVEGTSISRHAGSGPGGTGGVLPDPRGIDLEGDASPEHREKLLALTERYCVVLQTLWRGAEVVLA